MIGRGGQVALPAEVEHGDVAGARHPGVDDGASLHRHASVDGDR
jgi:hypothetical protein